MFKAFRNVHLPYPTELLHLNYTKSPALANYLSFYREDKLRLFFVFILYLIKASPVWVIPIVGSNIINLIEEAGPGVVHKLVFQFAVGAAFALQNIPTHIWFIQVFSSVNRKVEMMLRSSLCTRLQHLSIPYHTNSKMGGLQTKVLRDVENVEQLSKMLVEALPGVIISFLVIIAMTLLRAPIFLVFYLLMVPIAVLICKWLQGRMRDNNREFRMNMEDMSGKVIEMLRLITVTRAHGIEDAELERVHAKLKNVKDSGMRLDVLNSVFSAFNWAGLQTFSLFALFAAAYLRVSGMLEVGIGTIFLLWTYFGQLSGAVLQLMNLIPAITKGFESVKSIGEVLECPDIEMNDGKPPVVDLRGEFEFHNVSFCYDGATAPAVEQFSLRVKQGEIIALVGPSGSGKSTLMQLLIGFIRPTTGEIRLDGQNMNDIDLRSYRRFISVVSQESILFDGTIRENITYGAGNACEEDIQKAIECANLEDFVKDLPEGLETRTKENGGRLSGGQKQRMAIARALLRDPKVLLLDEATSALDVESEAMIQEALDRLIKGRTTFIIAHRLSTIRNADRIVVMSHGQIAELGTHQELMDKHGIYYRMNLGQFRSN